MADNRFSGDAFDGSTFTDAFALTPHDSNNFARLAKRVYVGGAGDIVAVLLSGATVTFKAVPVGTILPVSMVRINATSTTATQLVGIA